MQRYCLARMPSSSRIRLTVEMQPALTLQAEKTRVLLVHSGLQRSRGVDVADRHVTLVPERVVGQVVLLQVLPDFAIAPVGNRMQLPAAVAQFEEIDVGARTRLAATQSGDPGPHAQLIERALHGFDLAHAVV